MRRRSRRPPGNLDLAELAGLEAAGGIEVAAEAEEVFGRHGLDDVDLVDEQALDGDDAAHVEGGLAERAAPAGARAERGRAVDQRGGAVDLVQDELEP